MPITLKISATCKYVEAECSWYALSKNPALESGMFETYKEAIEDFKRVLKNWISEEWKAGEVEVRRDEMRVTCKDAIIRKSDDLRTELDASNENIVIKLKYILEKPENHSLSEYESITISRNRPVEVSE